MSAVMLSFRLLGIFDGSGISLSPTEEPSSSMTSSLLEAPRRTSAEVGVITFPLPFPPPISLPPPPPPLLPTTPIDPLLLHICSPLRPFTSESSCSSGSRLSRLFFFSSFAARALLEDVFKRSESTETAHLRFSSMEMLAAFSAPLLHDD